MSCDVDGRNLGKTNDGVLIREKIEYCMKRLSRKVILVLANIKKIFLARFINCQVLKQKQAKARFSPSKGTSLNIAFCWCPSTNLGTVPGRVRAVATEVVLGHRARARAPCPSTGTNMNRFSSVPAVFTFLQTVKERTPNLSPISQYPVRFPGCL